MNTLQRILMRHRMRVAIRYLVALLLWLTVCAAVVGVASAQTATVPPTPPAPPLSACTSVAAPQYDYLTLGRHIAFVCTNVAGTAVYPAGLSCLHSVCSPSAFGAAVVRVSTSGDYRKAIDTEWAASVKWTCDAPPDAAAAGLCAERRAWIASNWAVWSKDFKPTVWKVKPNGTATTRPAYSLTAGVLGTKEVARAPVGTVCDLTKPTAPATNGDVRAEFGTAGVVTICVKDKL